MRTFTALAGGALAAIIGLAAGQLSAAPIAPAAPAAVCTINVGRVFQGLGRYRKLQEDLQGQMDGIQASLGDREQELKKMAQDLEARAQPGTPDYEKERKKIEMRLGELKYDAQADLAGLRRKQVTGMAALYREVTVEAERIATEKGYGMVFSIDDQPIVVEERGQVMSANDLKLQMALRTALWADPALDITEDVIKALEPK